VALAAEGALVAVADVNVESLTATAKRIDEGGGRSLQVPWDLSDLDAVQRHADDVVRALGAVDILVNITGGPPPGSVSGISVADWRQHFDQMVMSVVSITDRFLPSMVSRGWGRVITSTSSGVVEPIAGLGISNTLRSSLVGWSKTLAREVGPNGVTVNVVVPGRIATSRVDFLDRARAEREGKTVEEIARASADGIALRRYGTPEEYADVVAFLASERAAYINGSLIRVDGGLLSSV
jgi:3-oxoacyl-[acyl-carrier protein] reductase